LAINKLSNQINSATHNSHIIKQALIYQPTSPIQSLKGPKKHYGAKVSLPSISVGRKDGSKERSEKANNLYIMLKKK